MKKHHSSAFTLVELLSVMAIIALLAALTGPAFQALSSAGNVDKAMSDLNGTLQLARSIALAKDTYVRVTFSQMPAGTSGNMMPEIIVLLLFPANGDPASPNMNLPSAWPAASRPLVLQNLILEDSLNSSAPDTSGDSYPSQSDMASLSAPFSRSVNNISPPPTFTGCIQFDPTGEARVLQNTPARYIKLALDKPSPQNGKDPFILRLSGINGTVTPLQKGSGIP